MSCTAARITPFTSGAFLRVLLATHIVMRQVLAIIIFLLVILIAFLAMKPVRGTKNYLARLRNKAISAQIAADEQCAYARRLAAKYAHLCEMVRAKSHHLCARSR